MSRVLNYDETLSVNAATKKRIFEIAEELEYRGKNQKKRKRRLSLLLINYYSLEGEVEDPYYLSVRIAIERRAAELGCRLVSISEKDESGCQALTESSAGNLWNRGTETDRRAGTAHHLCGQQSQLRQI